MWIGQRSFQSNSLEGQYKCSSRQKHGQDLQPDMESQSSPRIAVIESCHENGRRDDEEERDDRQDGVGGNIRLVVGHFAKAIAHACIFSKLI